MTEPKFNNRPNRPHTIKTGIGEEFVLWDSRSVSVDAYIYASCNKIENGMSHILTIKRTKTMRDEPNKFGVPCGYLDWNETTYETMIRELYQETSLYLPNYERFNIFDYNQRPFFIDDDPKSNKRQNVVFNYMTILYFENDINSFPRFIEQFTSRETARVKWMTLKDFQTIPRDWAFNQDEKIMAALAFFNTVNEQKEK